MSTGSDKDVKVRIAGEDASKPAFASATESIEGFEKRASALTKPFEALKGAMEAAGAFMVGEFVAKTIEAAAAAEQAWVRVDAALENAGIGARHVHGDLEQLFESMSKTSRFSEKDLSGAFATLLNVTNDYGGSVKNLELVANIAVARQMDLSSAATLVGRVMDGNTSMLKRYGIVLREDGVDPMTQLAERFNGFAEKDASSLSGALAKIGNDFERIKERIGDALMGDGARGGLASFDAGLITLGDWVKDHHGDLQTFANDLGGIAAALASVVGWANKLGLGTAASWVLNRMGQKKEDINSFSPDTPSSFWGSHNPMQDAVQKQLEIDANARKVAADKAAAAAKKEMEELRKHLNDNEPYEIHDLLYEKGLKRAEDKEKAGVTNGIYELNVRSNEQNRIAGLLRGANPHAADLTQTSRTSTRPGMTRQEEALAGATSQFGFDFKAAAHDAAKALGPLNDGILSVGRNLGDLSTGAIQQFVSTWGEGLAEVIHGHESLGKAMITTARKAVGGSLQAKGQETLLDAAKAAIMGLTNPAEFAKAAGLFALGSAEMAAGAALAGGGGGGSSSYGGGGGGISSSSLQQQQSTIGGAMNRKTTVVFKGSAWAAMFANPTFRDEFTDGLRELSNDGDLDFLFE